MNTSAMEVWSGGISLQEDADLRGKVYSFASRHTEIATLERDSNFHVHL